ncbi:hypothetical protein ACJENL_27660, partial [Escherichia coli]
MGVASLLQWNGIALETVRLRQRAFAGHNWLASGEGYFSRFRSDCFTRRAVSHRERIAANV